MDHLCWLDCLDRTFLLFPPEALVGGALLFKFLIVRLAPDHGEERQDNGMLDALSFGGSAFLLVIRSLKTKMIIRRAEKQNPLGTIRCLERGAVARR